MLFLTLLGKDHFSEIAFIYGLREYGKVLSDRRIGVERSHVLEFWRDCIAGSKRWLALTYVRPDETWDTAGWGGAISHGIQQERILAGSTIKRVFIVDDENEYQHLKQTMKNQESIGIEVRWLTKNELLSQKVTKDCYTALETIDVCVVDDTWVFKVYLSRERRMVRAEAIKDSETTEQANILFNEAFGRGKLP